MRRAVWQARPVGTTWPDYSLLSADASAIDGLEEHLVGLHLTPWPPATPVTDLDSSEALTEVTSLPCLAAYHRVGWPGTSPTTWLRTSVADRLDEVAALLPARFSLAIYDGWRSIETIRSLYAHYYFPGSTLEPGYLAAPDTDAVPPHRTGAAVDLTLTFDGHPLSLGTPFDEFSPRAHLWSLADAPGTPTARVAARLRRLLHASMAALDFEPFAEEWWHYSWGDTDWATARDWSGAVFGPISP